MDNYYLLGAEAGDAIYALPAIKALGGGVLWAVDRPWCRPDWQSRCESIRKLVESQSYISALKVGQAAYYTHDLTTYRSLPGKVGETIVTRIARYAGVTVDQSLPWLEVDAAPETKGRIIVSRGPRWRGYGFPWKQIVSTFQPEILFVGLDDEYNEFCATFGHVQRLITKDLYDVARAIKGSELFIGSQSSPNAVCEGLKHPSILEVCPTSLDCIYHRETTRYCYDGSLSFEACGKLFTSQAHWKSITPSPRYRVLFNNNEIRDNDVQRLTFLARAAYAIQGEYPLLDDIRAKIEQDSRLRLAA